MPVIPSFTNTQSAPVTGTPRVDPGAMAAPWSALARGADQVSEAAQAFEDKYRAAKLQADASNYNAKLTRQLGDMQFRWSQTPDRDEALKGFDAEAGKYREQVLGEIQNPELKAYVSRQFDQEATMRALATGGAAFEREGEKRRGDLVTQLDAYAESAAGASDEFLRAHAIDNAVSSIKGAAAGGWINEETAAKMELGFKSNVVEVGVRRSLNAALQSENPEIADQLVADLNDTSKFTELTPEKRESLSAMAEAASYRLSQRIAARQAREDAESARALRKTQNTNEAQILAGIHAGKAPSTAMIEDMAGNEQLTPEGVRAIYAALDRQEDGRDSPRAAAQLWERVGSGDAEFSDVYAAFDRRELSKTTQTQMIQAIAARGERGENAVERAAYSQLRTALSGGAVEQGIITDETLRSKLTTLWTQGQGEWNRRVTIANEDPNTVLADMLPRYTSSLQIPAPTWLPAPRAGAIVSETDVVTRATESAAAFKAGRIDQATYDRERALIDRYREFYRLRGGAQPAPAKPATPARR